MRFAIPNLSLVVTTILVLVRALTCAFAVLPLAGVGVPAGEDLLPLAVFLAVEEVAGIKVTVAKLEGAESRFLVFDPVSFVAIAVFQYLCAVSLFQAISHFTFVKS